MQTTFYVAGKILATLLTGAVHLADTDIT